MLQADEIYEKSALENQVFAFPKGLSNTLTTL